MNRNIPDVLHKGKQKAESGRSAEALRSGTIVDHWRHAVARFPDHPALVDGSQMYSYVELERWSHGLAYQIANRVNGRRVGVGLMMDQGAAAVAAQLAIIKAGCWCVPFDPAETMASLTPKLEHAQIALILVDVNSSISLPDMKIQAMTVTGDELSDDHLPDHALRPDDLIQIYYTSGTTGIPKGVMDTHRNVLHNIYRYTRQLGLDHQDRLSMIQSCAFSGAVSSLWGALLNGGVLCPYSIRRRGIAGISAWVRDNSITIYHSVPAIFRSWIRNQECYPGVRVVRLEGDRALPGDLELFKQHFLPDAILAVGLGATETGLTSQWKANIMTSWRDGYLPVGKAVPGIRISVRDHNGRECPAETAGEIWIHSEYLSPGYWRDEEKTRQKFIDDPKQTMCRIYRSGDRGMMHKDGTLEFLGRMGREIKWNGNRIDLNAIERALNTIQPVREAMVAIEHEDLVAYLEMNPEPVEGKQEWRREMVRKLSPHERPSRVEVVSELPRNGHFKMETRVDASKPDLANASLTTRLASIWKKVMGDVGSTEEHDFMDLGGTSLQAALICRAIAVELGREIPETVLREHGTPSRMAAFLGNQSATSRPGCYWVQLKSGAEGPPVLMLPTHWGNPMRLYHLAQSLPANRSVYAARYAHGGDGLEKLAAELLADAVTIIGNHPLLLVGVCYGGTVAWEMARQHHVSGGHIQNLLLLHVGPGEFPGMYPRFVSCIERLLFFMGRVGPRLVHLVRLNARDRASHRAATKRNRALTTDPELMRFRQMQVAYQASAQDIPVHVWTPSRLSYWALGGGWRTSRISPQAILHRLRWNDFRWLRQPHCLELGRELAEIIERQMDA